MNHPIVFKFFTAIIFGGVGGWDYPSLDMQTQRLFVSHSDRVVVIDTEKDKVIGEVKDTTGVHGIAVANDLKKAFSSNGKEDKISVIDLATLKTKTKIPVGQKPDAIAYESGRHEVYVFNGVSKSVSIIDAKSEKVVATLILPGKPEFAAVDSEAHRVFVNIEDKNLIVAINGDQHKVEGTWPLTGCESPTGLAIDVKNHRLFSVCENKKMVMVDNQSGKVVDSAPIGEGADGVAFDDSLGLAFSPNGASGTLTIIHEDSPSKLSVVQDLKTQIGARTIALDSVAHRVYLPTADLRPSESGKHRKPVDGTQRVLVYSLK